MSALELAVVAIGIAVAAGVVFLFVRSRRGRRPGPPIAWRPCGGGAPDVED